MAVALRCLRAAKFTMLQRSAESFAGPSTCSATKTVAPSRNSNTLVSPDVNELDVSKLTDYETSNEEWHYVERLIPLKIVPQPKHFDGPAPSGWIPPRDEKWNHPYFVPRNKNHMMPVYLLISYRGSRHVTVIRRVEGDIWKLEEDIRKFLKEILPPFKYARLGSRVNEMSMQVRFRGDYVAYIQKWMETKGF